MTDPWEEQERSEQQWAYEDALREENEKLRELCNDMWSVMSCEYASDAMADACRDVLDCDMDEVERRVNELCKEES